MTTPFYSGYLSSLLGSFNANDIMSGINYVNYSLSSTTPSGNVGYFFVAGLIVFFSNGHVTTKSDYTVISGYGNYGGTYATIPIPATASVEYYSIFFNCKTKGIYPSGYILGVSGASITVETFINNNNAGEEITFFGVMQAPTTWTIANIPHNFSNFTSAFASTMNQNDVILKNTAINYSSTTSGSIDNVMYFCVGPFLIVFSNGAVEVGSSKKTTVTVPIGFDNTSGFSIQGFANGSNCNIVFPYVNGITTSAGSTTVDIYLTDYFSSLSPFYVNFILFGQRPSTL